MEVHVPALNVQGRASLKSLRAAQRLYSLGSVYLRVSSVVFE